MPSISNGINDYQQITSMTHQMTSFIPNTFIPPWSAIYSSTLVTWWHWLWIWSLQSLCLLVWWEIKFGPIDGKEQNILGLSFFNLNRDQFANFSGCQQLLHLQLGAHLPDLKTMRVRERIKSCIFRTMSKMGVWVGVLNYSKCVIMTLKNRFFLWKKRVAIWLGPSIMKKLTLFF